MFRPPTPLRFDFFLCFLFVSAADMPLFVVESLTFRVQQPARDKLSIATVQVLCLCLKSPQQHLCSCLCNVCLAKQRQAGLDNKDLMFYRGSHIVSRHALVLRGFRHFACTSNRKTYQRITLADSARQNAFVVNIDFALLVSVCVCVCV